MEYTNLGKAGLKVSRLCLGCMSYGMPERGSHPWSLDDAQSRPFLVRALELGINFFDTSNSYSDGTSEEASRSTSMTRRPLCRSSCRLRR
jgi:aryl-alcohol dehydrogenase-like predicted oxidoreductase